jgi:hypothetical protein
MAQAERIQLPERDEITERALSAGVPEVLAGQLGRVAGESHLPEQILRTVAYTACNHRGRLHGIDGLANTDRELGQTLLEHYPAAVEALVVNGTRRRGVLGLWEREQRPLVAAGNLSVADWHGR